MHHSLLSKCVLVLLIVLFVCGAVVVVTFPYAISRYLLLFPDYYNSIPDYHPFVIAFCMLVGALGLWILFELILMLRTLPADPFVMRNVRSLQRMGYSAAGIAALFFGKCIMYFTPLSLICGGALLLCGLFSLILSSVFRAAVEYKRENDLTI